MNQLKQNPRLLKAFLVLQAPLLLTLLFLYFGIRFVQDKSLILAAMLFALALVAGLIYFVAMKLIFRSRGSGHINERMFLQLLKTQGQELSAKIVDKILVYTAADKVKIEQALQTKEPILSILDELITGKKMLMDEQKRFQVYLRFQYQYEMDGRKWLGQAQIENPFLFEYLNVGDLIKIKVLPQKPEIQQLEMTQWHEEEVLQKSHMPALKNEVMARVAFGLNTTMGLGKLI